MFARLLFLASLANLLFLTTADDGCADPNAMSTPCGGNCGKTCVKSDFCTLICEQNGCSCKDSFLFDAIQNKCVKPENCSNTCETNEVFSKCINNICSAVNCSQLGNPIPCSRPNVCESGCVCKAGFLRDNSGNCIQRSQCQKALCPNENEKFDPCPSSCPPQTCDSIGKIFNCPFILVNATCNPACRCKKGFFRNAIGECISEANCNNASSMADFNQGSNAFTGEFLYQMFQMNHGKSFVASPFSVLIPLAQLGLFAEGNTFDQIKAALNLKNKDQIRSVFPAVIQNYKQQQQIQLLLAAKIYSDIDFPLSSEFLKQSLQIFGAEGQDINFDDPTEAADIVNNWVKNETEGFIEDLVSPSFFTEDTRLVLANVIYFLGNWSKPFDENNTEKRDFFLNSKDSIQISTMFQENTFNYIDSMTLNSQIVQLSYKGGNVSCVIVLPKEKDGIIDLVNKSRDGTALLKEVKEATLQKVRLFLPIIETTSNINLQKILQELNITSLFDLTSDLQGILQNPEQLQVTNAIQKCRIKVNEKGTEAAAANVIGVSTTAVQFPEPEIFDFIADHTFLYYIILGNSPIFCGIFAGPQ